MSRVVWTLIAALSVAVLFYVSRFWTFRLWPRDGLFGIDALRPQGKLTGQWLRGTDFAPFELLIWGIGAFIALSILQKLYDLLNPPPK
ncbi:MAG: hypothetical protein AAGL96_13510 [Pseudomonadota bacterium]